MADIFISYRFHGEYLPKLRPFLKDVQTSLRQAGHESFCALSLEDMFRDKGFSNQRIYDYLTQAQNECDTFLAIVTSERRSDGMDIESARAIELGQRYILAVKRKLHVPHFFEPANEVIKYQDTTSLHQKLRTLP